MVLQHKRCNMKTRKLRYGLPYEPYIHEPELRFFEGELMGEQEPPPAQPRLFEFRNVDCDNGRLARPLTDSHGPGGVCHRNTSPGHTPRVMLSTRTIGIIDSKLDRIISECHGIVARRDHDGTNSNTSSQ